MATNARFKARDVLGIDIAPYDVMVEEVVGQYLELAKREGKFEISFLPRSWPYLFFWFALF